MSGSGGTPVDRTVAAWAASHPSLARLAQELGAPSPGEQALLVALDEWHLVEMAEDQPDLVVAALVEADRTGSYAVLDAVLGALSHLDVTAPLMSTLAARDEALTMRCLPLLVGPRGCWGHLGALTTVRVLAAEWASPSAAADLRWSDLHAFWSWPPDELWQLLMVADDRLPSPREDLRGLWEALFERAPDQAFRPNPTGAQDAEVLALVHAHVQAFAEQVRAVAAVGSDVTAWTTWIGQHQPWCGEPSCCRPSRFEAELMRRGFWIRVGRTPRT